MRIMLADQNNSVRLALRLFLQEQDGVSIISEVCRAGELMRDAPKILPDLIIIDWDLADFGQVSVDQGEGASLRKRRAQRKAVVISSLHHLQSSPQVVALCNQQEDGLLALYAGADAFLFQGEMPVQLISLLKSVQQRRAQAK